MSEKVTKICKRCKKAYGSSVYKTPHPLEMDDVRNVYCPVCRKEYHRYINECYSVDRINIKAQYGRNVKTAPYGFTHPKAFRGI